MQDNHDIPLSLKEMAIGSVDTLRGTAIQQKIPPTWRDQPPLLIGPRNTEESPQLLKGVLRQGIPPPLRCAVWLSNVVQAVHPHQEASYWHEYRTLAKAQALGNAYEVLLKQILQQQQTANNSNNKVDSNEDDSDLTRVEREEKSRLFWEALPSPTFGGKSSEESWGFIEGTTAAGRMAHKRVLMALQRLLGMEYAPALPTLVAVLLTMQSEAYAFCAVRQMAHQTGGWYWSVTPTEQMAYTRAFADVLHKLHPQTAEYLQDRGVLDDMDCLFARFLVEYLPLNYVWRIIDLYTLEGIKVLFRFGVALLVLFKKQSAEDLLTISNAQEWWKYFKEWTHSKHLCWDTTTRKAYGVHGRGIRKQMRFPRRHILQRIIRMEEERLLQMKRQLQDDADSSTYAEYSSSVLPASQPLGLAEPADSSFLDNLTTGSTDPSPNKVQPVLATSMQDRMHLAEWMPLPLRLTNLQLLYSTNHHGRSLEMLYNRVKHAKHTILLAEVLSPGEHTVVGIYASQAWRVSPRVYGDGSCFLFRLKPNPACWKWKPAPLETSTSALDHLEDDVYEEGSSSHDNAIALLEQFMVSTPKYISMGGNPDGSSGLRLNEDLTKGESSPAVGFDNEALHGISTGGGSVFEVGLVEVYGLVRQIDGRAV